MKHYLLMIAGAGFFIACNNPDTLPVKDDVLTVNLDTTVKPGDDIYIYASGGWIKKNPIPGEEGQWGIGNLVVEENTRHLREISESARWKKLLKELQFKS